MSWTANDIKNLILMELDHETITDWTDKSNTDIAIVNRQYELIKKIALSRYAWSFALKHTKITLDEVDEEHPTPNYKYKYVAELPEDALCNIACYSSPAEVSLADYYVVGNTLCANDPEVYMQYTANVPECCFTAEFVDWLKVFGAERLNSYINGDMQRQQLLMTQEPVLFRTAKNIDCKRNRHESLTTNPLLSARGNRTGYIG